MKSLTTSELLQVWEYGLQHPLPERTIHLLTAVASHGETNAAALSLGQRDIRLLQLREWFFGSQLTNTTVCPKCTQQVVWENDISDFRLQPLINVESAPEFELSADEFNINFRLPNIEDMTQLYHSYSQEENALLLLRRCLLRVQKNGVACDITALPAAVLQTIEERMGKEDKQAQISLLLDCPACSHQWEMQFDIQRYLWTEINAWAKNILQEVYMLAKYFGWSEQDILCMKPQRRQLYLEMIFA
ncbi:MAG: hypothetical protein JWR05_171 [Mucilaginibacter sp.]|nr:hypothetical protein [Mucilaginibacter sp.]